MHARRSGREYTRALQREAHRGACVEPRTEDSQCASCRWLFGVQFRFASKTLSRRRPSVYALSGRAIAGRRCAFVRVQRVARVRATKFTRPLRASLSCPATEAHTSARASMLASSCAAFEQALCKTAMRSEAFAGQQVFEAARKTGRAIGLPCASYHEVCAPLRAFSKAAHLRLAHTSLPASIAVQPRVHSMLLTCCRRPSLQVLGNYWYADAFQPNAWRAPVGLCTNPEPLVSLREYSR